jgi:predicted metal-dependent phosphotriesterase family hydrolase
LLVLLFHEPLYFRHLYTTRLPQEEGVRQRFSIKLTMPYNHISDDILPALRAAGVTEEHIEQMLVHNPRAMFEARHSGQA